MKKKKMIKKALFSLSFILVLVACSSDDSTKPEEETNDSFDRQALLVNWADNIIVLSYAAFNTETNSLVTATTTFTENPTVGALQQLRETWIEAYLAFQHVSMFEIGKAEALNYRNRVNVYPTNASEIDGLIADGNYDFSLPSTIDAQGFPAMDYLINGLASSDEEIITFYTTNENAENYKAYLNTLAETISTLTETVLNDWNNGYRDTFVNNTSSSASGSVDKLANDYVFYYEKALRAGKVGIPAGVFSNDPLPEKVEAFYKEDISKILALEALEASQNFFEGKKFDGTSNGESFKTYLAYLNTIKNGENLGNLITAQFETSKSKLEGLNTNFSLQIENDNSKMLTAYNELQRNVILLKVDMLQAMDISVDYVDADGD
ncbi:imelysin family protein [Marixanthomonas ophiurae]|uniref:Peptidase M75 superfamily protein n=1 Tax=Marixanthomonas ophiurae TaxID=387659 RepID=A0A3E1QDH6_9FLAO|nr:imelysin family protein [Marixanthomonas ophiurae]RFN60193.1 peptidase M75 superfamily protein [Marixanthomonas ophiurae]